MSEKGISPFIFWCSNNFQFEHSLYEKSKQYVKNNNNKTKVLSVQLGKTLGLNNVPITETEKITQV